MALSAEDRLAIYEVVSLHGHVFDNGEFGRLDEVFTHDVVYDASAFVGEPLIGIDSIRDATIALGERNPLAHHVTNIVVIEKSATEVHVRSKGIGVTSDGGCGTVTYEDVVVRTPAGWRIRHRTVLPRRQPITR